MCRFAVFYFSVCVFTLGCGTEPIGNVADLPLSGSEDDSSKAPMATKVLNHPR